LKNLKIIVPRIRRKKLRKALLISLRKIRKVRARVKKKRKKRRSIIC
jgi:hypothetical protein